MKYLKLTSNDSDKFKSLRIVYVRLNDTCAVLVREKRVLFDRVHGPSVKGVNLIYFKNYFNRWDREEISEQKYNDKFSEVALQLRDYDAIL